MLTTQLQIEIDGADAKYEHDCICRGTAARGILCALAIMVIVYGTVVLWVFL